MNVSSDLYTDDPHGKQGGACGYASVRKSLEAIHLVAKIDYRDLAP